ncbi:MAG: hypothetical protein KDB37_20020 [Ilumatobacter sp.]|nr:hypothetical protein [Ilumatobacter sp.]
MTRIALGVRAEVLEGEIGRVMGGDVPQSSGHAHGGGEWDWLPLVDRRTLRRLTSAGYFRRNGLPLDMAADLIRDRVAGVETFGDAIEWYVSTALRELDDRQARRAGVVRWEDQERPEEDWADHDWSDYDDADDDQLEPLVDASVPWQPERYDGDDEPAPAYPDGARPTFYGSARPVRRASVWDSAPDDVSHSVPDDVSRRRRGWHGSAWWSLARRVSGWFR